MVYIPFEQMMDFLMEALEYWSSNWNSLNVPLKDWIEPTNPVFGLVDVAFDAMLEKMGIGDFTLLQFVLGSGVAYLTLFIVLRWVKQGIAFAS